MTKQLTDVELSSVAGGTGDQTRTYCVDQLYLSGNNVFRVLKVYPTWCFGAEYKYNDGWKLIDGDSYNFSFMSSWIDVSDNPEYQSIYDIPITFGY